MCGNTLANFWTFAGTSGDQTSSSSHLVTSRPNTKCRMWYGFNIKLWINHTADQIQNAVWWTLNCWMQKPHRKLQDPKPLWKWIPKTNQPRPEHQKRQLVSQNLFFVPLKKYYMFWDLDKICISIWEYILWMWQNL